MPLQTCIYKLCLRHPFGLSRDTVQALPTVLVAWGSGLGEAAPVRYLGDSAEALAAHCIRLGEALAPLEARKGHQAARVALHNSSGPSAAKAAIDVALWDAEAQAQGVPLTTLLGTTPPKGRQTSLTIALDDPTAMQTRAEEAAAQNTPSIKIKLGRNPDFDRQVAASIRHAAPHAHLRVDANAGWSFEQARDMCRYLADLGVELVEQPLAIGAYEQVAALCRESPLPIYLDEDIQGPQSLRELPRDLGIGGINIKLMKCGGVTPALEMIELARERGLEVLLGCMIETQVGLRAAAALGSLVAHLDLDAHLLTTNDPFASHPSEALQGPLQTDLRQLWDDRPGLALERARFPHPSD